MELPVLSQSRWSVNLDLARAAWVYSHQGVTVVGPTGVGRIHASLMTFGHNIPVSDLFGTSGRELLAGLGLPEPWTRTLATSPAMLNELDERIDECGRELARLGADHRTSHCC